MTQQELEFVISSLTNRSEELRGQMERYINRQQHERADILRQQRTAILASIEALKNNNPVCR